MMAALSRVLEEAWKLGLMSAEDYHRAIAIERKTGQRLLKGRALSIGSEKYRLYFMFAPRTSR